MVSVFCACLFLIFLQFWIVFFFVAKQKRIFNIYVNYEGISCSIIPHHQFTWGCNQVGGRKWQMQTQTHTPTLYNSPTIQISSLYSWSYTFVIMENIPNTFLYQVRGIRMIFSCCRCCEMKKQHSFFVLQFGSMLSCSTTNIHFNYEVFQWRRKD